MPQRCPPSSGILALTVILRVSRAAMVELRAIAEHHLQAHGWSGKGSLIEASLDPMEIASLLLEGLAYARDAHPWIGLQGAVVEPPATTLPKTQSALVDAFFALPEPRTLDACIEALSHSVPFHISEEPSGRQRARPRAYPLFLGDWPVALAAVTQSDRVFGIIAERGWIRDPAQRLEAFRAALPWLYEEIPFVEIDGETAQRVAAAVLAGPNNRGAFDAYVQQASAWVQLFGPGTRAFANRDFDDEELHDPFAHVETYSWSSTDDCGDSYCASGRALALVVTDGLHVAFLDAIWETSSE